MSNWSGACFRTATRAYRGPPGAGLGGGAPGAAPPGVTLICCGRSTRRLIPRASSTAGSVEHYRAGPASSIGDAPEHRAGEKMFVDYAGQTVEVIDRTTGEMRDRADLRRRAGGVQLHLCRGDLDAGLPDWIGSHVRAFEYFGGVREILVPDNLRSGVTPGAPLRAGSESDLPELASHYGVASCRLGCGIRATRPRSRRVCRWSSADPGRAAQSQLLLPDRAQPAIADCSSGSTGAPSRSCPARAAYGLREPRPTGAAAAAGSTLRVRHLEARCASTSTTTSRSTATYYSVPYALVKQQLEVRLTAATVECFHKGQRVASQCAPISRAATPPPEHMPKAHREYAEWTPQRLVRWAEKSGPATAAVDPATSCQPAPSPAGLSLLPRHLAPGRALRRGALEAACGRALRLNACRYQSIESILEHGLDRQPLARATELALPPVHDTSAGPTTTTDHNPHRRTCHAVPSHPGQAHHARLCRHAKALREQLAVPDIEP